MKRTHIGVALASAAGLLATSALSRYLQAEDVIGAEAGRRITQVVVGLALAVWGNFMPKGLGSWPWCAVQGSPACAAAAGRARSAVRVGGWAITLAGVSHASLWAFAPLPLADVVATTALVLATVVTLMYGAWTLLYRRPRSSTPGQSV